MNCSTIHSRAQKSCHIVLARKFGQESFVFCPFLVVSANRYHLAVSRREHRCLQGAPDPGVFLGVTHDTDLSLLGCRSAHVEDKAMHLLPLTIGGHAAPSFDYRNQACPFSLSDCPPLQRVFCHIPNGLTCLDLETPCVYFRIV